MTTVEDDDDDTNSERIKQKEKQPEKQPEEYDEIAAQTPWEAFFPTTPFSILVPAQSHHQKRKSESEMEQKGIENL